MPEGAAAGLSVEAMRWWTCRLPKRAVEMVLRSSCTNKSLNKTRALSFHTPLQTCGCMRAAASSSQLQMSGVGCGENAISIPVDWPCGCHVVIRSQICCSFSLHLTISLHCPINPRRGACTSKPASSSCSCVLPIHQPADAAEQQNQ